jgi:Bacterial extracellular solute-binding protein.
MTVLLCVTLVLASCSNNGDTVNETTLNNNSAEEIVEITEAETAAYDAHLPDMDFSGADVRILNMNEEDMWWTLTLACPESETGEVINDAVYTRNRMIEEKYNLNFAEIKVAAGSIVSTVTNSVKADSDDYDIILPFSYNIGTLAMQGMLYDLATLDYIDFNNLWWGSSVKDFSIDGRVYFAISDFLLSDKENVSILMYNKKIADNLGMLSDSELYQLVNDGGWVWDKFIDMIKAASADLNGNGTYDIDDRYGLMTADYWAYPALMSVSGQQYVTKNSDDIPVFTANNEKFINIFGKIMELMNDRNYVTRQYIEFDTSYDHVEWGVMFTGDKALFCNEVLSCVRLYKEMESDFAVVPLPKLDETQDKYYSYSVWATCIGMPVTVRDPDKIALALDALSSLSRQLVIPAYYEVAIAVKYFRDDMSFKMLDIILENQISDVLHLVYDWGGFDSTFKNSASAGKTDITSLIESNEPKIVTAIQKTVDAYNSLP